MAEDEQRAQAVKRIKRKRGFWKSAVTWLVISAGLVGIWAITGQGFFWPAIPIGIFVLVLALRAWRVYGKSRPISEEEIQREMKDLSGT